MDIQRISVPEFKAGHGVVGTSAQEAGPAFPCVKGVKIKADLANTDFVYVGHDANVTDSTGFVLDGGEEVEIPIDYLNKIFVIGGDTDQGYSYTAV